MRDCARFLFNHNPFYPLSAALIMVGTARSDGVLGAARWRCLVAGAVAGGLYCACWQ